MATITDYASLSTAITDFEARTDIATYLDYFIQGAEDEIYNDIFKINEGRGIPEIETTFTGTIASNTLALPASFLGLRSATVTVGDQNQELQIRPLEFINAVYPTQAATGVPAFVARSGSNFVFGPYADDTYTVSGLYWKRLAGLTSSNTSTWMITDMPTTLFANCMRQVGKFLQDPQRVQYWTAEYQQKMESFIEAKKSEDYAGSALSMVAL